MTMQKTFNHIFRMPIRSIERIDSPEGRRYKLPSGILVPSVTTILGSFEQAGLETWKNRVGQAQAERVGQHARDKGGAFHEMIEEYLLNKSPLLNSKFMPTTKQSFLDFKYVLDNHIDDIWHIEQQLYSEKMFVAGTVDLIAYFDHVLSVIDFKTARKPKSGEQIIHYFEQATAYALMYKHLTGVVIDQIVIAIAVENSEPQIFVRDTQTYKKSLIQKLAKYHMTNK